MRYRLIELNSQRYLTLDHDLLQKPFLKCEYLFYRDQIGTLYNEDEITTEMWKSDIYAVKVSDIFVVCGRCCGRCDGINDICVTDMTCEAHKTTGCELCYGKR